jgi:two-component sensor histidine kinase
LFTPAVFLCVLVFDKRSGFFATALSTALAPYFIEPRESFTIGVVDILPLAIFVGIGITISVVTDALRQTVQKLAAAEQTKGLLLQEMAHRMKNDLAMVSSVLILQARGQREAAARTALETALARVNVIAMAQERLRGAEDGGRVKISDYLETLCTGLGDLLRDVRPIAVRVRSEPCEVTSSEATSIGLIVNELVTNALKYAFPDGRGGIVDVELRRSEEEIIIRVWDDGIGCPEESPDGLGSRLIRLLAKQMDGAVWREPSDPGCQVFARLRLGR